MGKRILLFNFIYYAVIIGLILSGIKDPSSSLGYGYFIIIFWIISAVLLVFFLIRKIIWPQSLLQKIGVFTATPVLSIVVVMIFTAFRENVSSTWVFNKNGKRYKQQTIEYASGKRIEYY